jgi:hypothetical protein
LLYFHHTSSLHHDARELSPDHPDVPERIKAIEAAMALTGWSGCERRRGDGLSGSGRCRPARSAGRGGARGRIRQAGAADSGAATVAALAGPGTAESIAPEQIVTPRAAAHISRFWAL